MQAQVRIRRMRRPDSPAETPLAFHDAKLRAARLARERQLRRDGRGSGRPEGTTS